MASVQELLAAAEASKSPFISLLEGAAGGFGKAQDEGLDNTIKLMQIDQMRREQEYQAQRRTQLEQRTKQGFNGVGGAPNAVMPTQKLKQKTTIDSKGYVSDTYETVDADTPNYQAKEYLDAKGRARIGRFNPKAGFVEKSDQDSYAPQTARGETAGNLRKEFIDRPEVKAYQSIDTQVKSMDSLLTRSMSGDMQGKNFLDQALVTIFNKINDPSSVVRESEYARTPEGLALANRIQGSLSKLSMGGAGLTDEDRKDLVTAAKIIANERGGTYAQTRSGYIDLAKQMTLDPSLITATMPDFSPYDVTLGSSSQSGLPKIGETFQGGKVISIKRIK